MSAPSQNEATEAKQEQPNIRVPHLIVSLDGQFFAIAIQRIQEILSLPKTVPIPNSPQYLRGAINLRGKVVPILDLRLKLGMASSGSGNTELQEMLYKRESDHIQWVTELERSLRESRPFALAKDHRSCAFGKWFYTYKPSDSAVKSILVKFEEPHHRLHQSAHELLDMADRGQRPAALDRLQGLRKNELRTLRGLFEELRNELMSGQTEQVVIFKKEDLQLGLCVDTVDATEIIDPATIEDVQHRDLQKNGLVTKTARNSRGEVVLMLDVEPLLVED